jgi:hypothetical protein
VTTGIFGPWDSALDSCKNGLTIEYKPKMLWLATASASQIVIITKFLTGKKKLFVHRQRLSFFILVIQL